MTDVSPQPAPDGPGVDENAVVQLREARDRMIEQIRPIIVGMDDVIEEMMIAIFARGHCLLVGVPGLAKTLLVSSLAQTMSLSFKRIQFTPDLMPSDITGTEVLQDDAVTGARRFEFLRGPVFANLVLADEINRTPPKTQAALLEAMQEKKVSMGGEDYPLDDPFFVLATQNPIEQEGTYPLPEAQLDRFLFNILVQYPTRNEEFEILKRWTGAIDPKLEPVISREDLLAYQDLVRRVPVADHIVHYASTLARSTRPAEGEAPPFVRNWVGWGAGPRAGLFMILAGKARAVLKGRAHVSIDDIQAVARPVLRHRLILNFAAQSEGVGVEDVITRLLDTVPTDEKVYDGQSQPAEAAVS